MGLQLTESTPDEEPQGSEGQLEEIAEPTLDEIIEAYSRSSCDSGTERSEQ